MSPPLFNPPIAEVPDRRKEVASSEPDMNRRSAVQPVTVMQATPPRADFVPTVEAPRSHGHADSLTPSRDELYRRVAVLRDRVRDIDEQVYQVLCELESLASSLDGTK